MELAIDTSTRYASVGLSQDGMAAAELTWRSDQNHSVELVPAIRAVMDRAGVEMADLKAVFLARGPGAFSALRVGMSTAKALSVARGIPLVAVNTLDVEAAPYLGLGYPVRAVIDAGHGKVYLGSYCGGPPPNGDGAAKYESLDVESVSASVSERALFCGEGAAQIADALRSALGDRAVFVDAVPPTRSAASLARLAHRRWRRTGADDVEGLQPLYIRGSQFDVAPRD